MIFCIHPFQAKNIQQTLEFGFLGQGCEAFGIVVLLGFFFWLVGFFKAETAFLQPPSIKHHS